MKFLSFHGGKNKAGLGLLIHIRSKKFVAFGSRREIVDQLIDMSAPERIQADAWNDDAFSPRGKSKTFSRMQFTFPETVLILSPS